jgi:hypothetical protein
MHTLRPEVDMSVFAAMPAPASCVPAEEGRDSAASVDPAGDVLLRATEPAFGQVQRSRRGGIHMVHHRDTLGMVREGSSGCPFGYGKRDAGFGRDAGGLGADGSGGHGEASGEEARKAKAAKPAEGGSTIPSKDHVQAEATLVAEEPPSVAAAAVHRAWERLRAAVAAGRAWVSKARSRSTAAARETAAAAV